MGKILSDRWDKTENAKYQFSSEVFSLISILDNYTKDQNIKSFTKTLEKEYLKAINSKAFLSGNYKFKKDQQLLSFVMKKMRKFFIAYNNLPNVVKELVKLQSRIMEN